MTSSRIQKMKSLHPIDYSKIDLGIRNLVSILNEIPFVMTIDSCEGHLTDYSRWGGSEIPADRGYKFLEGGEIIFKINKEYRLAREFLAEIKLLEAKYNFVRFYEYQGSSLVGQSIESIEGSQVLRLHHEDLTSPEPLDEKDNLAQTIKKWYQVPADLGEKRVAEYQQVWSDVLQIVEKYARLTR